MDYIIHPSHLKLTSGKKLPHRNLLLVFTIFKRHRNDSFTSQSQTLIPSSSIYLFIQKKRKKRQWWESWLETIQTSRVQEQICSTWSYRLWTPLVHIWYWYWWGACAQPVGPNKTWFTPATVSLTCCHLPADTECPTPKHKNMERLFFLGVMTLVNLS